MADCNVCLSLAGGLMRQNLFLEFVRDAIDLVYISAKIVEIIFSVVIIQVGTLTFQFLKSKFLC